MRTAHVCAQCAIVYLAKQKFIDHIKNCRGVGVLSFTFTPDRVHSLWENVKKVKTPPFSFYMDYETTSGQCGQMRPISYELGIAFSPEIKRKYKELEKTLFWCEH